VLAMVLSCGEGSGIRNPCGNHCTVSVIRVVDVDGMYIW
jgi:hypothetical protein